jgi:hypothetical protein
VTARFGAVVFRHIRDKELYRPSGWPSWRAFCAYFSPEDPERIDVLIRALEVLESRGEKRDFGMPEARALAGWGGDRRSEEARADQIDRFNLKHQGGTGATYLEARLRRSHPDIAAAFERGEFKSLKAAAHEAGIVKDPDPVREVMRWWRRSRPEQRAVVLDLVMAELKEDAG